MGKDKHEIFNSYSPDCSQPPFQRRPCVSSTSDLETEMCAADIEPAEDDNDDEQAGEIDGKSLEGIGEDLLLQVLRIQPCLFNRLEGGDQSRIKEAGQTQSEVQGKAPKAKDSGPLAGVDLPVEIETRLIVDHAHCGSGYGHPTDAGKGAVDLMAGEEDIRLDQTYTGKAFGALLDFVAAGQGTGPVLFWNTFNSVDLSPLVSEEAYLSLPEQFHRFFS